MSPLHPQNENSPKYTALRTWLRRHVVALVVTCVVALLAIAPHFLAVHAIGDDYKGNPFLYLDDEEIYIGRMHEILDGHPSVGSPFFYEYKESRPALPPLGEMPYAFASRVSHLPLTQVVVASKAVVVALLFWLVYLLLRRLTADKDEQEGDVLTAIAGSLLVVIGYELFNPRSLSQIVHGADIGLQLMLWTRTVNPISGALLLFGYLVVLWRVLNSKRVLPIIVAGLLQALAVSYIFSWAFSICITGFVILFCLVRAQWALVKRLCAIVVVSCLATLPYWIGVATSVAEGGKEFSMRNGMMYTHVPLLNKTILAACAVFVGITVFSWARDRKNRVTSSQWWTFCASMLCAGVAVYCQQVVTGRTVWPHHFVQYTEPVAVIALMAVAFHVIGKRVRAVWSVAMVGLIGLLLVEGIIMVRSYHLVLDDFRSRQVDMSTFNWIDANTPIDCVVLVREQSERLGRFIPGFTHCNVYLSTYVFAGVPIERVRHNFMVYLRMQGVTNQTVHEYLMQNPDRVRELFFDDWNRIGQHGLDPWVLEKIEALSTEYQEFFKRDFAQELKTYRIDILATQEPLSPEEQALYGVTEAEGKIGNVYLYKF